MSSFLFMGAEFWPKSRAGVNLKKPPLTLVGTLGKAVAMHVLVIGSGGREHALCWALARSPRVTRVLCAPGNPGIAEVATCVPVATTAVEALLALARREAVDLTVVGPEAPLAAGIADAFLAAGLPLFGPTRDAARLESSKAFAKAFMARHRIPTARSRTATDRTAALQHLREFSLPVVIKQDGLAAGKGVVIATTQEAAEAAIRESLGAGGAIVIEEFLSGTEVSCIAIASGTEYVLLETAQDHKRIGDGDTGPNTGGMGAYSPVPWWTPALRECVQTTIIEPTLQGMQTEGISFTGFLYCGLMIVAGRPFVLEYNTRLGDPEAQALLIRLRSDLATLLRDAAAGRLARTPLQWDPRVSVGVVMSAAGYPEAPRTGDTITGPVTNAGTDDVVVFQAGTRQDSDRLVTAGGRVLTVTALGDTIDAARTAAYARVEQLGWPGAYWRRDIATGRTLR